MKNIIKHALFLFSFLVIALDASAQLDTEHYIPPLFGREDQGNHYIVLSTPSATPFDVTITDGAGNLITTQTISNASSSSYFLGAGNGTQFLVTEAELNTVMTNEGLILTGNFPFYVNLRVEANPQAGSLTSKGAKASFGQDFRTGHLFNNNGDAFRKSNVFGIMATEDNTTVNITDITTGVIFRGTTPVGAQPTSPPVTVVLNAGETYVVSAFFDEPLAIENVNGVNGTRITSDKDIVVNTGSWLGGNALVGGTPTAGRDLGIDQIVPVDLIGDEYVVIKGEGIDNEKVIVVGTQNGTDLFLNGSGTPTATINAGDYYVFDVNDFTAQDNMYITSTADVYAYQTANGGDGATDDNERQCGLNFLPPIGCSGSKSVLLPDVDFLGTAQINIIANSGSNVYVDGVLLGAGDVVTGTANYVTYKLSNSYTGDILITSDDLTRVALINLSGNVGAAGYFSGFTKDVTVQTQTVNGDNIALEGCIPASFNFSIDGASAYDTQITYQIGGTATNGIDYQFIDTLLTIPAGQTSGTVFIHSIADGLPEGQETIYIIYQSDLCSPPDTAFLFINDAQPIQFTLTGTDLTCYENNSGQILVNASGGFPAYTYHVTDDAGNGTTTLYTGNPITGLPADTYSVQVYDIYGCKAEALIIGGIYDADTTFLPDGTGVSYQSVIPISGFQNGQTLDNMTQLQQVCATMEHSYLGDLQIKVISPSGQEVILKQFNGGGSCDLGEPFASGPVDGANSNLADPGVGYDYCWNTSPNYGTMVAESNNYTHTIPASTGGTYTDNYLPAGAYTSFQNLNGLLGSDLNGNWIFEVSDQFALDNGYIFNWNISLMSDLPDTIVTLDQPNPVDVTGFITQATCGGTDGSIDISVSGDFPPYTYNWSTGQTTEDISGIGAGTYTVYVTNANGCTDSATFNLNNISSINTTSNVVNASCAGFSNGAINVTTSGGTPPYTYSWSSGQTTQSISSIAAGSYALTITDAVGCIYTQNFTVNSLPPISISLNTATNEVCSQQNGAINVNVSGGTGSYGYSWDNGATTQDLTSIGVGTYYLTVIDAAGCSNTNNFSIINDVSNCSAYCYTNIVLNSVSNEVCGDASGSIDIAVFDATPPYTVSWSNGAITEDLTGLSAGSYTVTILDANQCQLQQTITVGNQSGTLAVTSNNISNENCGSADGTIDIIVSGGTSPYAFVWSNGATTEDVSNLSSGTYTVTITDNVGCVIVNNYSVGNNTGTLAETAYVINEICGNSGGTVNITVSGGVSPYSYLWSNGATTQDLTLMSAGTYFVTITDAVGCQLVSQNYTVNNSPGDLTLLSTNITNENCGDGLGSIDITVIDGDAPYSYSWDNGAIIEDLAGLSAGTFVGTITDNNGCVVSTGTVTVFNQSGTLAVSSNTVTDEVCSDGSGSIDIDVTGGTAPFTFLWSNGATTEDITGLSAGVYSVDVTDANGCTYNFVENVQNNAGGLLVALTSVTNETCGDGTGAINITPSSGTAPYSYLWSNGATSEDVSSLNSGIYSVTVSDASGCQTSVMTNVTGSSISIQSSTSTAEICGDQSGAIDVSFSGGLNPYSFAWSNGASTEDISGLSAGSYSLTITDALGCMVTQSFSVANNTNGLNLTSTIVTDENCGDAAGAIDVSIVGGANPISYAWSNGATTQDLSGLSAGTYNLVVTDLNGCSVTTAGTVTNISAGLTASTAGTTDETCGDATGTIDLLVSGGSSPFTFSWNNGATTEDLTGLAAGTYNVTVTDNLGCSVTASATIANQTGGFALSNAVIGNASCASPSGFIDLSLSGGSMPYTFAWSNGATTEDISGLTSGTYTCVITDNAGCIINYSGTVNNAGGSLTATEIIQNELCGNGNGSITVNVSGGIAPLTYSWSGASPSTCCDYTLDMQDLGNSWNGAFITVLINGSSVGDFTVPGGGANSEVFNACSGDNIELVWSSGAFDNEISFDLLDPTGTVIFSQGGGPAPGSLFTTTGACPAGPGNQTSVSGLSAGSYSLTITDGVGCQLTEVYSVGNTPSDISTNLVSVSDETCANNNGEIMYTLTGGTGPFTTTANGFVDAPPIGTLSNLYADDWEIITVDANGCTDTIVVTVNNVASFTVADAITNETCGDLTGAVDLTITGGSANMSYVWSNGATTEDISGLAAGTYTVTITDNTNGCDDFQTYVIGNTVDITLVATILDEACGDGTGAIDLTVTGSSNLTISWSNGASTEDISGLSSGVYSVTVINNASGCAATDFYIVSNTTSGMVLTGSVTDENCSNTDGAIDLSVTGGVGPFSFAWSNGAMTEDVTGLSPGTYNVTVIDQNDGCSTTASYTVVSTGTFNLDLIGVVNETCGGSNGSIDIDLSGPGTFNPTVLWTPGGATTEDIFGLAAGTYSVSVTNAGGCEMTLDVDVLADADITVLSLVTDEACSDAAGAIDLTVAGSTNLTFSWSNGATSEDLTGLSAGNYDVSVVNNNSGCTEFISFTVANVTTGISFGTATVTDELCSDATGAVDISVSGGVGPYSYLWTPGGETTEDISGLSAGSYSVTVTDDNDGCAISASYVVTNSSNFTLSGTVVNSSCPTCTTGSIDLTINETIADGPYTFIWTPNGETTEDISGLIPGVYAVTVTGASGCSVIIDFTVGNNDDVGFEENPQWQIALYPNPTRTEFYLNYDFAGETDVKLNMTNLLGELIFDKVINDQTGLMMYNVAHLGAGIYFLNFETENQTKTIKLIITE